MSDEKKTTLVNVADFGEFDNRRYGKPWLAKLKGIPGSVKLKYEFVEGAYVEKEDGSGTLMGYFSEGDYVAYGQKDYRGNSSVSWYGIYHDGEMKAMPKTEIISVLSAER